MIDCLLFSIDGSIAVAFWALFGLIELDEFDTEEHYSIMSSIAKIFFALFNVVAVLVTLNMLIAILNESFIQQAVSNSISGYTLGAFFQTNNCLKANKHGSDGIIISIPDEGSSRLYNDIYDHQILQSENA